LTSWGEVVPLSKYSYLDDKNIYFLPSVENQGVSVNLFCPENGITQFTLETLNAGTMLRYSFIASTQSGRIAFNPYIFPITNMSKGKLMLGISSGRCKFK
jgi:hypothetical protein